MEGAHPPLTEDDGAAKVLLRGLYDAVSLAEVRFLVGLAEPGDVSYPDREPVALREASLVAITYLVEHGLMELGDLEPVAPAVAGEGEGRRRRAPLLRFEPWAAGAAANLARVRREWWDPERDLDPGNICWLENTAAGNEVARAIEAAREG